ncbi:MAG TPA: adenylate/guanylate cyclase domain-containing protein [Thermoanaerobaculia bacterium]|nr:adenylate/guanylate cyclase domain-containing protein [Thermoanaerobaculia bacterium]
MTETVDVLAGARGAASRQAWREAFEAYAALDEASLTPADLEHYGEAAWWTGRLREAIALRERAYTAFAGAGEKVAAARVALTLSWDESNRGAFSVAHGWFSTAQRLLEGEEESVEHGRIALTRAVNAMFAEGNYPAAIEDFDRAFEIAGRFGDRDTQMLALVAKGRALVKSGEIEQGLQLIDEGTVAAVSGELQPYSTTLVYCMTISSCHDLGDFRRAAEWTEAANRWCDRLDVTGFPGACRIHRAEIMRLRGDLEAAEKVATAACEELADFERYITSSGYYEIGEIRRRLGDLDAAEEAYRRADELGGDPQPGLALLRLAEGKLDAAVAGITRTLGEVQETPGRLRRLPAQVEIAVAAGDLKTARKAASELEGLVDSYKIGARRAPAFDATVHIAAGRIALAEGDTDEAVRRLRDARDGWREVGAPFETAQARLLLGVAFRRGGDEHAATAELEAAHAAFERIGARRDAERAAELLGRQQTRRTFLFTDIVGSTRLLETLGNDKWRKLLARHNELVAEGIAGTGGEVVQQTGDGFFAVFTTPRAALEAAIAIQRALEGEIVAPDVRIGVHTGAAFEDDAGSNGYGGEAVHIASRIGSAAGAGEILASREALDGAGTGFRVSEPRSESLKGFEQPVDVVAVDWR